jgi:hypothetical protein
MSPCICNPHVCVVKPATSSLERSRQGCQSEGTHESHYNPSCPYRWCYLRWNMSHHTYSLPTRHAQTLLLAGRVRSHVTLPWGVDRLVYPHHGHFPSFQGCPYLHVGKSRHSSRVLQTLNGFSRLLGRVGQARANDPTCSLSSLDDRALYDHGPTWSGGCVCPREGSCKMGRRR